MICDTFVRKSDIFGCIFSTNTNENGLNFYFSFNDVFIRNFTIMNNETLNTLLKNENNSLGLFNISAQSISPQLSVTAQINCYHIFYLMILNNLNSF